jgi:hypothetical protein
MGMKACHSGRGRARQTACGGRKRSASGRWLSLKGSGREGGTRRGGRRMEAERKRERGGERGGPGARRGAARWRVVGATAARPRRARATRCRTTVEDGGVGGTRSTWLTGGPGCNGGPIISCWVGRGADRWGRQHSAPDSVFKPNQIDFKRFQICPKF